MFGSFIHGAQTLLLGAVLVGGNDAQAQQFPAKPVRAVLPYSAGSGPDTVMRQISENIAHSWRQPLLIGNKPGANSWIALQEVKRAAADGYTVLAVDSTPMTLQPHLYKQLPFDPLKDFEPIASLYSTGFFVVVRAESPWKNVSDLLTATKKKHVTFGSWGIGSVAHLGLAQLEAATGVEMTHVPFKELPMLYAAVATGQVDWTFGTPASAGPLYRGGKVKLLAYAGPKRLLGFEEVPTMEEAGGPRNFELRTWLALYTPKGVPSAVSEHIRADVEKALGSPEVLKSFALNGFESWTESPERITELIRTDSRKYGEIARRVNISLD
ncbi:Bug family tripartite tricarboxylate transporter substrate binding protein [Hydrogenophaga sp. BPS33]|uniref:Bug family tripartite tricarboxylate transporter substrate binding protein n=1 Tax=Hydrogenophaga sp. BPS33 TaxID=2651974 RepID=UPI00131F4C88|nr:tripartite tricarboxylate transporter substrate binding protein [Hydrogenophaga sp. BPS33]QHE84718.1 tripartite tricarboxylate transporter substrate binding protein [Hydrogenophaga sp. BPS33]